MTILDRYIARTLLLHTLMVMAVLLALMTLVTFIGQQDDIDCREMVELRMGDQVHHRAGGAGLGVGRGEDHAREARMHQRHRAHCAGLERDVQGAAGQAVVA